jgi:phosphatidylglycerol:prolipoprotein diacylglycerol transferase
MHPIFIEIGSLSIRWYGVMAALGFLAAVLLVSYNRKIAGMNRDQATTLVFIGVFAGIIGARIAYIIQFWDSYKDNPLEVFRIDRGGLVFYGGFFLAMLCIILYCRKNKFDVWRALDIVAPALTLGHMFGRIGCFLNGCCFGKPTQCLLGVAYPPGSLPDHMYGGLPLHPVQLYEAAANLILFGVMFYLARNTRRGITTASYLIAYGVLRFADEFFRGDHADAIGGYFTRAQTIGIFLIPAGIILLIYFMRYDKKNNKTAS